MYRCSRSVRSLPDSAGGKELKKAVVCLAGITVLLLSGCSSVSISYDFDRHQDFAQLKTFAWMPDEDTGIKDARHAQLRNDLFTQRLRRAVNSTLESKGYSIDTEKPDFTIVYHTGVQDKVNVTNWGYTYGPYWGPWGQSVDVHQYTEGTLILDFINWETKELIWRGTAQSVLSSRPDPDKVEQRIQEIVDKLLANFPPK
jgi:hypothetical protein